MRGCAGGAVGGGISQAGGLKMGPHGSHFKRCVDRRSERTEGQHRAPAAPPTLSGDPRRLLEPLLTQHPLSSLGKTFHLRVTWKMSIWSSRCGATGWAVALQHQDSDSIPGLAQWVQGSSVAATVV